MSDWRYTFQEFSEHLAAFGNLRECECIEVEGELINVGRPETNEAVLIRMRDYLRRFESDTQVWFFKLSRFFFIIEFATKYREELQIPEACLDGTETLGMTTPILRAIHHYHTVRSSLACDPTLEQVIALAQKYRDDESPA